MRKASLTLAACVALLWATSVQAGLTAAAKCEATKNQEAGKYSLCLQQARAKLVQTKGTCSTSYTTACYRDEECPSGETCNKDLTKYGEAVTKCKRKFAEKWQKAIDKATEAGGTCPDGRSTDGDFQTVADVCSSHVATGLGTGGELSILPASGQTTSYGPGSDGDVQAGATLSYKDNGDGTITDNNTGLMWEKKDESSGIHDKDNTYTWGMPDPPYTMNGTMVTEFLATLNTSPCFAGYCDWRIPNVKELQSIVDYEIRYPGPVVNAAFHNAAGCTGCTDVRLASCSCTRSSYYWSSTTYRNSTLGAWGVYFTDGTVGLSGEHKDFSFAVRAVRGGL